eukprot:scaffold7328_cov145-Cylindrotheca_fusiformis.AAC.1
MSQENKREQAIPHAPYPPQHQQNPKSSLSSSPQYSASPYASRSGDDSSRLHVSASIRADSNYSETSSDSVNLGISAVSEKARVDRPVPSRIQINPSANNVIACINCKAPNLRENAAPSASPQYEAMKKRKAPILLELRQLEFTDQDSDDCGQFFATRTIGLSRGNPNLGMSVASTSLDMPSVDVSSGRILVTVATGITTGALCIHSFSREAFDDKGFHSSTIEYFHTPRRQATATSVAWRPSQQNQVAVGLLGNASTQAQGQGQRRGGGAIMRTSGSERDWGCLVWDIEKQQSGGKQRTSSAPLSKLSHSSSVASLSWIMDGRTLAVGGCGRSVGGQSTVQLYDMRVSGTNAPPITVHAHNAGVNGIEMDPIRPHLIATFCRAIGEPVKLWDVRRMDTALSEIKVGSANSTGALPSGFTPATFSVEAIKWAQLEPGTLSIATGSSVQDYDTKSGSRPVLVRVNHAKEGSRIRDFALYPQVRSTGSDKKLERVGQALIEKLYSRRILTVLEDGNVCDMTKHKFAPLAISHRDGRIAHALGASLFMGSVESGLVAMDSSCERHDEDISATMVRRARCFRVPRYNMDTVSNIKMLSEDVASSRVASDWHASTLSLLRLWTWINRVESLCESCEEIEAGFVWPAKSLCDAGVWSLLGFDTDALPRSEEVVFSETLKCNIYESERRRYALASCGWAGKFSLANVLGECEELGEYERSAALAVWHGDIGAAVKTLQRASEIVRHEAEGEGAVFLHYAETLDLIAMCIAGFGSSAGSVWEVACSTLLKRDAFDQTRLKGDSVAYLRALCQFLLCVGTPGSLGEVLGNMKLGLSDRVAFACRFLEHHDLKNYLSKCINSCQSSGNIEGLVVSGLSRDGIQILQSFVDGNADIQTAALVVSRAIVPGDWTTERRSCIEWVESYRGLLNRWQMWTSRSMFDVDRADLLRRIKSRILEGASSMGSKGVSYQTRRLQIPTRRDGPRSVDPEFLSSIPAQLDARCNYCSSPLGLKQGITSQWLSKMRPVLSCCPQCRKPLPRCAICLLPLGCLNPYMELTRDRSRSGARGSPNPSSPDDLSSLANLPFAEW